MVTSLKAVALNFLMLVACSCSMYGQQPQQSSWNFTTIAVSAAATMSVAHAACATYLYFRKPVPSVTTKKVDSLVATVNTLSRDNALLKQDLAQFKAAVQNGSALPLQVQQHSGLALQGGSLNQVPHVVPQSMPTIKRRLTQVDMPRQTLEQIMAENNKEMAALDSDVDDDSE